MSNTAVNLIRAQIQSGHETFEGTLADVSNEEAHRNPGGLDNPIGAMYAHLLTSEDGIVNGMLKSGAPLFASEYAGKAGFSEPPPAPSEDTPGLPNWHEWAGKVEVDLDALREYAQAVYATTDAHLATLSDADLDQKVQTAVGEMTVGQFLSGALVANYNMHCGEIACLKGMHGKKGYPV